MSALPLPIVDDRDFSARLTGDGPSVQAVLRGTADLNVQKQFEAFLIAVHAFAIGNAAAVVGVDLRGLEFMNSSCLKSVVNWIFLVQAEPVERRYRITFTADPKARWQQRTLQSLVAVSAGLISVED